MVEAAPPGKVVPSHGLEAVKNITFGSVRHGRQRELEYRIAKELLQSICYPSAPLPFTGLLVAGAASGALTWLVLKPIKLMGTLAIIPSIHRHHDLPGFWRGQMGTLVRETGGSTAWFGSSKAISALFRSRSRSRSESRFRGAARVPAAHFHMVPFGLPYPRPIIHLNGFPGTGKLTVARHLVQQLGFAQAKLVHNHLLIDPADAILHRTQSGYQPLRRALRAAIFTSLVHEDVTHESVYIFTDFQSSDALGSAVCAEYAAAALARGSLFVPVVLTCQEATHLERVVAPDRADHHKLTDVDLVRRLRRESVVHRFVGHPAALEMDVTELTAQDAARRIRDHLMELCSESGQR
ncbi:MAG: hypothetical protein M1826_000132 [Phylliscum demangeonii]|nr:MAG: hypothetical protein M1826_000132 [Phylliscum demangeonii]